MLIDGSGYGTGGIGYSNGYGGFGSGDGYGVMYG